MDSPLRRALFAAVALAAMTGVVVAEEEAATLLDRAVGDLTMRRNQATDPPLLPHLGNAVSFAGRVEFIDPDHVAGTESLDALRQATSSTVEATREALRAGDTALAEALKADCDLLARAARRLAVVLLGDAGAIRFPIDATSAAAREAGIAAAERELARGDALLGEADASFRDYAPFVMPRFHAAIARFKDAWLAARDATRFRLGLAAISASLSVFSPNADGRRETVGLSAELRAWDPVAEARARVEWAVLDPSGATVRAMVQEGPIPAGTGLVQWTVSVEWDGRGSDGAVVADGSYALRVGGAYLPPGGGQDPLNGTLAGSVMVDTASPRFGTPTPEEGAAIQERRPTIAIPFADALSGIDVASVSLTVEGVDRTSAADRTAEGVSYTPTDPFRDGEVEVAVSVRDQAENDAARAWAFEVVSAVGSADPATGGTITVTDAESPVAGASVRVPPGAVSEPATFTIAAVADPPAAGDILAPTGNAVDIESSVSTFSEDLLLVIPYQQEMVDAAGIDERALEVFFYDGTGWVALPVVSRDTEANTITVAVRHLSFFLIGYRRADATTSTLTVDPLRLMADGQDQAAITVVPKDAGGVPLGPYRMVQVRFRVVVGDPPGPPPPGGSISGVTNAGDEFYRATLTSGTRMETVTIEALADSVLFTQTASVSYETPVASLVVIAPSQASAGGAVALTVRAVDAQGVRVRSYRGTVRLDSSDPEASFVDSTIALGAADAGEKTVPNVGFFRSAGTFRITAVDTARPAIEGESGDVAVSPGPPAQLRAVFGDFQSGDAGTLSCPPK